MCFDICKASKYRCLVSSKIPPGAQEDDFVWKKKIETIQRVKIKSKTETEEQFGVVR